MLFHRNRTIRSPTPDPDEAHSQDTRDEDSETENDQPSDIEVTMPGPEANRSELRKVLRDTQLKVSKLYKQLKKIKREKATLEAAKAGTRRRLQRTVTHPDDDTIVKSGRKFVAMCELWMMDNMKKAVLPPDNHYDNVDWNSRSRYADSKTQLEGIRRDMREVVPSFLHPRMTGSTADHFIVKFDYGMQQQRSNMAERARTVLPGILNDMNLTDRNMLLGFNSESGKYNLLPPVLFPNCDPRNKQVFASDVLINLGLALLRGPTAIRARKEGKTYNSNTVVKHWGLTSVTPGFIALVAILVRFALSGDEEFVITGESGITYAEDFKAYKLMLYKHFKSSRIQAVFDNYNSIIFPSQPIEKDGFELRDDTLYLKLLDSIDSDTESVV